MPGATSWPACSPSSATRWPTIERQLAVADAEQRNAMERRRRAEAERETGTLQQDRVAEQVAAVARERAAADDAVADAAEALAEREAVASRRARGSRGPRALRHPSAPSASAGCAAPTGAGPRGAERERGELAERLARSTTSCPRCAMPRAGGAGPRAALAAPRRARNAHEAAEAGFAARPHRPPWRRATRRAPPAGAARCRLAGDRTARPHAGDRAARARARGPRPRGGAQTARERERFGEGAIVGPLSDYVTADSALPPAGGAFPGRDHPRGGRARQCGAAEAVREWHAAQRPGSRCSCCRSTPRPSWRRWQTISRRVCSPRAPVGRWVRALLGQVRAIGDGAFRDARGRCGCPAATDAAGPLQRRAELASLREELTRRRPRAGCDHAGSRGGGLRRERWPRPLA
jgi:chromosome segregation protein